ncbi:Aminoglycoside phosphotransferase [Penicillium vulpinum]|uniref:Aminoglycoside phosphotransferase domain-containing protein n=1 Tax=Penicillium vulpinum TaxID=29845 RepID=A0A1V6RXR8_9EURO|nr:Aminoglycoside phosphotransferase [Penicillium vulpinum]KAJ5970171.1 Aminoglycoside phosphotransferase [Penicillium vulpinum]OQE06284.1 hypothetical protein PENVUL_c019G00596 [Penicillium vulpinum]
MGHLWQSLSEHLRGLSRKIISLSSSIVDHVTLKRLHEDENSDNEEEEDDDDDDLDSLDIDPFEAVLERVKVKHIGKYVAAIRAKTQPNGKKSIPVSEVESPTRCGEHVCYRVKFADGVSWLLKVPIIGTPDQFDEDDGEALRSEALTMIMLRRETTIPISEVFSYDNTCKNKLKVPFILLEFIDALPLVDVWHDRESPKEVVQARRTRCLQDIAAAYIQLGKYTFNEETFLRFDDQDCLIGVVPVRKDLFSGLRGACTSYLDLREEKSKKYERGLLKLLRMFVDWTPKSSGGESFVLSHPNPGIFSFLLSKDGSVRAILDWHGASAKPPSIGNETYPLWLMRDWAGALYRWSEEMEQGIKDESCMWEDSPDTLMFYREIYAQCIANLRPESENAKLTRNSLLFEHLAMAMEDSIFGFSIALKILNEIRKQVKKSVDDNDQPASVNPSNNNTDDNDSKNQSSAKGKDAMGDHNSPNKTEVKEEHDDAEPDIDREDEEEEEEFDAVQFLDDLDDDGMSEDQEKIFKAGFEALFIS